MSRLLLPKLMVISDSEEALLKCFNHFANLLSHYRDFDARKQLYAKTKHFYELNFAAATAILYATNFFFSHRFFFLSHNQKVCIVQRTCLEAVNKFYFFLLLIVILELCLSSAVGLCLNIIIQEVFNTKMLNLQKFNLFRNSFSLLLIILSVPF